jgi:murein DD-endopeptidase MepM/ murein hydrolase activator NlpD
MQRIGVTAGFAIYNPLDTSPTMHYAIDISRTQPVTYNVFAAHDGKVIMSIYDAAGGNMIAIQGCYNEKKDIITRYAHLSIRSVFKGDTVARGAVIGIQGNTGTATTGQHLHFETWIVPKNYTYAYSDRQKYAVDPISVCQLLEGQEFLSDAETFNYKAVPYPEPQLTLRDASGGKVTLVGDAPMYFFPGCQYSPYVAGYNRGKKYITDFFYDTVFPSKKTCRIDGAQWALVDTARGDVWVPILDGKSILTCVNDDPEAPDSDAGQLAQMQQELDLYRTAVDDLTQIISDINAQLD